MPGPKPVHFFSFHLKSRPATDKHLRVKNQISHSVFRAFRTKKQRIAYCMVDPGRKLSL
jgi:hypothetical protein